MLKEMHVLFKKCLSLHTHTIQECRSRCWGCGKNSNPDAENASLGIHIFQAVFLTFSAFSNTIPSLLGFECFQINGSFNNHRKNGRPISLISITFTRFGFFYLLVLWRVFFWCFICINVSWNFTNGNGNLCLRDSPRTTKPAEEHPVHKTAKSSQLIEMSMQIYHVLSSSELIVIHQNMNVSTVLRLLLIFYSSFSNNSIFEVAIFRESHVSIMRTLRNCDEWVSLNIVIKRWIIILKSNTIFKW